MKVRVLRLTAVLLPTALLMHEAVYALSGTGERASHGYLEHVLPVLVVLTVSAGLASLLLPLLSAGQRGEATPLAPLAMAGALAAIFAAQEVTEALLLGGALSELLAALASAWLLPPLALLLGMLTALATRWLDRAEHVLCSLLDCDRPATWYRAFRPLPPIVPSLATLGPLAFGLARRPPPGPGRPC